MHWENDEVQFTEEQLAMIDEFMQLHPEASRDIAIRFCLGRKFVKFKIEDCYVAYRRTIAQHHFDTLTVADVLPELRTYKLYIPGTRDKQGAALFVINAGKHEPGQFSNESTLRLAFYMSELLTSSKRTAKIGVTIISNMEGMVWDNFDINFQRSIVDLFQHNVPARVKNILLYKCPWWVSMGIRMVAPFLKEKIRERIHICEEGQLLDFIEKGQLPVDLGGSYDYSHGAFIRQEVANASLSERDGRSDQDADQRSLASSSSSGDELARGPNWLPPGTTLLVSDKLAAELAEERERVLKDLDRKLEEKRKVHSLQRSKYPVDIDKMLRSRATRIAIDFDELPSMEPNLMQSTQSVGDVRDRDGKKDLFAERAGENYDPERLQRRIARTIRRDRTRYFSEKEGGKLNLELDNASDTSLSSPVHVDYQVVPEMPPASGKLLLQDQQHMGESEIPIESVVKEAEEQFKKRSTNRSSSTIKTVRSKSPSILVSEHDQTS